MYFKVYKILCLFGIQPRCRSSKMADILIGSLCMKDSTSSPAKKSPPTGQWSGLLAPSFIFISPVSAPHVPLTVVE